MCNRISNTVRRLSIRGKFVFDFHRLYSMRMVYAANRVLFYGYFTIRVSNVIFRIAPGNTSDELYRTAIYFFSPQYNRKIVTYYRIFLYD